MRTPPVALVVVLIAAVLLMVGGWSGVATAQSSSLGSTPPPRSSEFGSNSPSPTTSRNAADRNAWRNRPYEPVDILFGLGFDIGLTGISPDGVGDSDGAGNDETSTVGIGTGLGIISNVAFAPGYDATVRFGLSFDLNFFFVNFFYDAPFWDRSGQKDSVGGQSRMGLFVDFMRTFRAAMRWGLRSYWADSELTDDVSGFSIIGGDQAYSFVEFAFGYWTQKDLLLQFVLKVPIDSGDHDWMFLIEFSFLAGTDG